MSARRGSVVRFAGRIGVVWHAVSADRARPIILPIAEAPEIYRRRDVPIDDPADRIVVRIEDAVIRASSRVEASPDRLEIIGELSADLMHLVGRAVAAADEDARLIAKWAAAQHHEREGRPWTTSCL